MSSKLSKFMGVDGIPYFGIAPMDYSDKDKEDNKPRMGACVYASRFELGNPTELADYTYLLRKKVFPYMEILFHERQYDEETKHWIVFVEWMESYYYNPKEFPYGIPHNLIEEVKTDDQTTKQGSETQ